jgi:hypothetical protein
LIHTLFYCFVYHFRGQKYVYKEETPPTLLAAGLRSQEIITGENTVTIRMNPLVVDTKFTRGDTTVTAARDGVSPLIPGD